jgi:hypothetical protein
MVRNSGKENLLFVVIGSVEGNLFLHGKEHAINIV